tara:strand:- start:590 stop:889 length:300 start_codon:yes stop_codon:yes gene_type:complete
MEEKTKMVLGRKNYMFIIIGCIVVLLGFVLMSGGGSDDPNVFNEDELFSFRRITLAPFLVMSGLRLSSFWNNEKAIVFFGLFNSFSFRNCSRANGIFAC